MKAGQVPRRWTAEFLIGKGWCRMAENKSTRCGGKNAQDMIHIWAGGEGGGFEYSVAAGCADWLGPATASLISSHSLPFAPHHGPNFPGVLKKIGVLGKCFLLSANQSSCLA